MDAPDWLELVEKARVGDDAARAELLRRFAPLAAATARRLVDSHDDVPDVIQDAFAEVLTTIAHLREALAFPAWLRVIVRKHADRLRRRQRRDARPIAVDPARIETPDVAAERAELIFLVRASLATLSDPDRRLLELRYFAGWTVAELARLLDVSDAAVRKRLHDARRRLRPALSHLKQPKEQPMSALFAYLDHIHAAADLEIARETTLRRPTPLAPTATGLKIVDAMAPVARGGTIEIAGAAGTGHLVIALELLDRLTRTETDTACVAVGQRATAEDALPDFGILVDDQSVAHDRHCVILTGPGDDSARAVRSGANLAAGIADTGADVLLALDRRLLDGSAPLDLGTIAGLAPGGGSVTVLVVTTHARQGPLPALAELAVDTRLVLSIEQFVAGIFPALDPVASRSTMAGVASAEAVRNQLESAARLRRYFAQPMRASEAFTGEPSVWVDQFEAEVQLQELLT